MTIDLTWQNGHFLLNELVDLSFFTPNCILVVIVIVLQNFKSKRYVRRKSLGERHSIFGKGSVILMPALGNSRNRNNNLIAVEKVKRKKEIRFT